MKRFKYIVILLMVFTLPCFGQADKAVDIELTIYPSSGGYLGYVIKLRGEMLEVISKELLIEKGEFILGKTIEIESEKLSRCQIKKVKRYLKGIENLEGGYEELELTLDVWVFDFLINRNQSIKLNSSLLRQSKEFKKVEKLVEYLKRLSPVKIKLRGFS